MEILLMTLLIGGTVLAIIGLVLRGYVMITDTSIEDDMLEILGKPYAKKTLSVLGMNGMIVGTVMVTIALIIVGIATL